MTTRPLSPELANAVYDVLVAECRASDGPYMREAFVFEFSGKNAPTQEYRFQGALGFGGKFRFDLHRTWPLSVDCYPEDETTERRGMIALTNAALVNLWMEKGGR